MRTWYPSPYGSYNRLLTTGNTVLARDSGGVAIGTQTAGGYKLAINGGMYADGYDMRVNTYNELINGTQPSRPGKLVYVNDTDQYYYSTNNPKNDDPTTWYKPVSAKAEIVAVAEAPQIQYVLDKAGGWASSGGYPGYFAAPWTWDSKYTKLKPWTWYGFRYNADGMEMLNVQVTGKYCMYNDHFNFSSYTVSLPYWYLYEYYSGYVVYGFGQVDLTEAWSYEGRNYLCGNINVSGSVKTYDGVYGTYFYIYQSSQDDGAYYRQDWQDEYYKRYYNLTPYDQSPAVYQTTNALGNPYCVKSTDYHWYAGPTSCQGGWAAYYYQVPHLTRDMKITITKMF